ncbi:MAG: hypothetical protein EAZ70_05900 [Runella slithyformis]|nr:MAG: hypothetical protein EAY79_02510 [Runella slithyformis]TAE94357.1 MAG: hypothetical protein EAZ80_10385 [Runella slithyformis]TAF28264.1 MAG: hypothetical protein EAZ70_05900 [Runella slithyformis]TAF46954.1 MAG: hypothetical protein EAZ63_08615 [Runella slithyformis]TAF83084.1 MAG: hypothetical protein EAZ50_02230 [Runella slithyformis]
MRLHKKSFYWLLLLTFGLIGTAIASYYHRYPTSDDAWFAEQSYWLLHDGKVRSEFFSGLLDWDKNYLASHKLFILLGAFLTKLFPDNSYGIKLSGLLFFVLLVILLTNYVWQSKKSIEDFKIKVLVVLLLLFGNTLLVRMSFENRPEMMVTTLGFCSFLLLKSPSKQVYTPIFAGIFAGLALLAHLNGVIFVLSGFLTLLLTKYATKALLFILAATFVSCFYFYDVLQTPNGLETWWFQFSNDPATQKSFGIYAKLKVLLSFPLIFVESPEQLALTVVLLVMLWVQRKNWVLLNKTLIIYTLSLLFCFWILTKSATAIYQVLFIPTMILLILELSTPVNDYSKAFVLKIGIAFYLIVGVVGNLQIIIKNAHYNPDRYAVVRNKIGDKAKGVVPINFFFNEYSHYPKLLCHTNYYVQVLLPASVNTPNSGHFFEWAKKNKVTFVLFDYDNDYTAHYPDLIDSTENGYSRTYFGNGLALYEIQKK